MMNNESQSYFLKHHTLQLALLELSQALFKISETPRLDSELFIASALKKPRSFIYAHPESVLNNTQKGLLEQNASRRLKGEPCAYILGRKEFFSLNFSVTPDTLIPRSETEHLVQWILSEYPHHQTLSLVDLGTGCGAIAITLAKACSRWQIDASDISEKALSVARYNAKHYHLDNINFFQGPWYHALPGKKRYSIIVSNPPYIQMDDPHLKKLTYEPQCALVSGKTGLDDIKRIIAGSKHRLLPNGALVVEHGYDQGENVYSLVKQAGFHTIENHQDFSNQSRFVTARLKK